MIVKKGRVCIVVTLLTNKKYYTTLFLSFKFSQQTYSWIILGHRRAIMQLLLKQHFIVFLDEFYSCFSCMSHV